MPAPQRVRRLGGDPHHQRQLMANLATRLVRARRHHHHRLAAKALRPYAEKLITKGKKGGVHRQRQVVARIHDQAVAQSSSPRSARVPRPQRWLHPDPEARAAPGRPGADGAHRARLSAFDLAGERHGA